MLIFLFIEFFGLASCAVPKSTNFYNINVDGVSQTVQVADLDVFPPIDSYDNYYYGPFWTLATFGPAKTYNQTTWNVMTSCSLCSMQTCGDPCPNTNGAICTSGGDLGWFQCFTGKGSYCYSLQPSSVTTYNSYPLNYYSVIGGTTHPGVLTSQPCSTDICVFFETMTAPVAGFNFSTNAHIKQIVPRLANLNQLYYSPNEASLLQISDLSDFDDPPNITTNYDSTTSCEDTPLQVFASVPSPPSPVGYDFIVVAGPGTQSYSTLVGLSVLSITGLTTFYNGIMIVDPCNLVYTTILVNGTSYSLYQTQYASASLPYTCVIVQDTLDFTQLHLYKITNTSQALTGANDYVGILISDYIQKAQIRVTTGSTFDFSSPIQVSAQINLQGNIPVLSFSSQNQVSCYVSLSPNSTLTFQLSPTQQNPSFVLTPFLPLFEKIPYICGPVVGFLQTPPSFSILDNSIAATNLSLPNSSIVLPINNVAPSYGDHLLDILYDWRLPGIIVKLLAVFAVFVVIYAIYGLWWLWTGYYPTAKDMYISWKNGGPTGATTSPFLQNNQLPDPSQNRSQEVELLLYSQDKPIPSPAALNLSGIQRYPDLSQPQYSPILSPTNPPQHPVSVQPVQPQMLQTQQIAQIQPIYPQDLPVNQQIQSQPQTQPQLAFGSLQQAQMQSIYPQDLPLYQQVQPQTQPQLVLGSQNNSFLNQQLAQTQPQAANNLAVTELPQSPTQKSKITY